MTKRLLPLIALALPALAQTTLKDALVKHWKVTSDFTIAVAKAMPADQYGFKPVPAEMSFGTVLAQVGAANAGACATASGMPRPATPQAINDALKADKDVDKETVLKYLGDTFDFCNQAVASMTPEKLDAVVGGTRKMTGFEWLWAYFTHTAHHRGQVEVYLRLKGIKPPDYTF
jgi:hypothetical protein